MHRVQRIKPKRVLKWPKPLFPVTKRRMTDGIIRENRVEEYGAHDFIRQNASLVCRN